VTAGRSIKFIPIGQLIIFTLIFGIYENLFLRLARCKYDSRKHGKKYVPKNRCKLERKNENSSFIFETYNSPNLRFLKIIRNMWKKYIQNHIINRNN